MKEVIRKVVKNLIKKVANILPVGNKIIFESSPDFADNTRAVFEYMIKKNLNDKYKMIWLVNDPKQFEKIRIKNTYFYYIYPKQFFLGLQRFYAIATAKYIIVCNRGIMKYNKKTVSINLWHGSGIKACKEMKLILECCDYVLTSSEFYKTIFEKELHVDYDKLRCLGYPRNDWMFTEENDLIKLGIRPIYEKVIMWMPTFRQHENGKRIDTMGQYALGLPIIESEEMLERLNTQLAIWNMYLIIKIHPAQDLSFIKIETLSHVRLLTNQDIEANDVNLYKIVGRCDALITDYSSIYVDYMLLDRAIAFTVDDIEDYRKNKGFIFEDPRKYMPGKHLYTFEDMQAFIEELGREEDSYREQREVINTLFNQYVDGQSCQRFFEYFKF